MQEEIKNDTAENLELFPEKKELSTSVDKSDLKISESVGIEFKNTRELMRFSSFLFKSKLLPDTYSSVEKIAAAIQLCTELGLKPMSALRQIYFVNGQLNIWGEIPLAIVMNSGKLEWIDEFLIDEKCEKICFQNKNLASPVWGAVCRVKRFGNEFIAEHFFSVDDQIAAGISDAGKYGSTVWGKHKKIMMIRKARGFCLKKLFPDCLFGVSIAETDTDHLNEEVIDPNKNTTSKEAEKLLKGAICE